ncbi:MAG: phosphate ABC transporter permease family protein, partial [Desulfotignum sp.]
MSSSNLLLVLLMLTTAGYYLGRKKAFAMADATGKGQQILHSRPTYYGALAALWCAVPALAVLSFWQAFESSVITQLVISGLPMDLQALPSDRLGLLMNDIKNLVHGNIVSGEINPAIQAAADHYSRLETISHATLAVLVLVVGIAG